MRKLLEQDLDLFSTKVKIDLSVTGHDGEVEVDQDVLLQYKIEMEYRSWGLKGIAVLFPRPLRVVYELMEFSEEDDEDKGLGSKEIEVDLSDAEIEYQDGDGVYPTSVELRIDKSGKVLEKIVNVIFIKKM